jgi:hypothetical protein
MKSDFDASSWAPPNPTSTEYNIMQHFASVHSNFSKPELQKSTEHFQHSWTAQIH